MGESYFVQYLENTGKSQNTIKAYQYDIDAFSNWYLGQFGEGFTILRREIIMQYLDYMKVCKSNSAKTINRKISTLMQYNEYLVAIGTQKNMILSSNDKLKERVECLSPTKVTRFEVDQFIQNIKNSGNVRNYALVLLMASTGIRISEALNLKLSDINIQSGECVIP